MKRFTVKKRRDVINVGTVIEVGDGEFLVLLEDTSGRKEYPADRRVLNIYAFYPDGSLKWRVSPNEMTKIKTFVNGKLEWISPFVALEWVGEQLIAWTFDSDRYAINPETGHAVFLDGYER